MATNTVPGESEDQGFKVTSKELYFESKIGAIYIFKKEDLDAFLKTNKISQSTKILSILYHTFPTINSWASSTFNFKTFYPSDIIESIIKSTPSFFGWNISKEKLMICAQVAATFLYACSRSTEAVIYQTWKLGKEATANLEIDYPTMNEYAFFFSQVKWDAANTCNEIYEAIGRSSIINCQLDFDPGVKVIDLAPIEDLKEMSLEFSQWQLALIEQVRKVYRHQRSINFVNSIYVQIQGTFKQLNGVWKEEAERFENVFPSISDRPFTGLRSEFLEEALQFPRIVLVALYWLNSHFPNKGKELENFKIETFEAFVPSQIDLCMAKELAGIVRDPSLTALAEIYSSLSGKEVEESVSKKSEAVKQDVTCIMKLNYPSSPWVQYLDKKEKDLMEKEKEAYATSMLLEIEKNVNERMLPMVEKFGDKAHLGRGDSFGEINHKFHISKTFAIEEEIEYYSSGFKRNKFRLLRTDFLNSKCNR